MKKIKEFTPQKLPFLTLFLICVCCTLIFDQTSFSLLNKNNCMLAFGIVLMCIIIFMFINSLRQKSKQKKLIYDPDFSNIIFLIIVIGFLIRFVYVLYTPVDTRQHDVFSFGQNGPITEFKYERHAEYIEYICRYLKLPNKNPTETGLSQLYHPPLHHILAALWLRFNMLISDSYRNACESIQFLTLFYSSCCMIISNKLMDELGLKNYYKLIPLSLICFHPTFIIMAGSVNNDILSITLSIYALLSAIKWYKNPSIKRIMAVGVSLGLSMMTKLSGALMAFGIAVLFIAKFFIDVRSDRNKLSLYVRQFALFILVCAPLGLWWQVKNAVQFGVPLTYVPALSTKSNQYVGNYSILERLFEIPKESLQRIFVAWTDQNTYASSYSEYNCILGLLKTSVFGEFALFYKADDFLLPLSTVMCKTLFWSNVTLALCSIISIVICIKKKWYTYDKVVTISLITVWAITLLSYIKFCFEFAQTCTQNFRYAVPALIVGVLFLAKILSNSKKSSSIILKIFNIIIFVSSIVFGLSSVSVYLLLGAV